MAKHTKRQTGKHSKKIATKKSIKDIEVIYVDQDKRRQRLSRYAPQLNIVVTQGHIDTAHPKDSGHCMIADAIKVAFPRARHVSVDLQTCRASDPEKGLRYIWLTPQIAQWSLIDWDEGVPVKPFGFQLRRPAQIVTMHPRKDGKQKPAHRNLGRRRAVATKTEAKIGRVPTVVGGRSPPQLSHRREFGLRAFRSRRDILISGRA